MTRIHVSSTARVEVDMIRWMNEHVGQSVSTHGDIWNQMRKHVGDDGWYTQAQGDGWEIMYCLHNGSLADIKHGI